MNGSLLRMRIWRACNARQPGWRCVKATSCRRSDSISAVSESMLRRSRSRSPRLRHATAPTQFGSMTTSDHPQPGTAAPPGSRRRMLRSSTPTLS